MPVFLAFGVACMIYTACAEPAPLYGTWSDNLKNTFSFFEDGTFTAKVTTGGTNASYEGNFSVLLNALTLDCSKLNGENIDLRVVTEWDIRGNMLYLDWVNEDRVSISMTLYKTSN